VEATFDPSEPVRLEVVRALVKINDDGYPSFIA
jgi:hypothetical protein